MLMYRRDLYLSSSTFIQLLHYPTMAAITGRNMSQ
jgi:hypothetical protein